MVEIMNYEESKKIINLSKENPNENSYYYLSNNLNY